MNLRSIAIAAGSAAVGAFLGYKYAEKKLITEFEERLDIETNTLRRMYKPEYDSPQDMVDKLHGDAVVAMREYQGNDDKQPVAYHTIRKTTAQKAEEESTVVQRSVFEPSEDRGAIYLISAGEHGDSDVGFEQVTWTYYAKDGVVTDVHDHLIEDYTKFLGEDFVDKFGQDSGDPNVVYIRNEIALIDYEILRSEGSYVEEVLQEEYTPPAERPSQRMRSD